MTTIHLAPVYIPTPSIRMNYLITADGVIGQRTGLFSRFMHGIADILSRTTRVQSDIVLGKGNYSKLGPIVHGRGRYFYLTKNVRCRNFTLQEGYVLYTLGNTISGSETWTNYGRILEKPIKPYQA